MLLLNSCILLVLFVTIASCLDFPTYPIPSSSCPNGVRKRKEVRDLTADEWNRFSNAIIQITKTGGILSKMATLHYNDADIVHGPNASIFLPYHRMFIWQLEENLRKIDASITLPYWDSSLDAANPDQSAVLTSKYYGSSRTGDCIVDGIFKNFAPSGSGDCVTRGYTSGDPQNANVQFPSSSLLGELLRKDAQSTFQDLQYMLQFIPHPYPHNFIGGQMATMMSPSDPVFYAHHAFIDKLWDDWQLYGNNKKVYQGPDSIPSFKVPVTGVLDTLSLCYEYIQSSAYNNKTTTTTTTSSATTTTMAPSTTTTKTSSNTVTSTSTLATTTTTTTTSSLDPKNSTTASYPGYSSMSSLTSTSSSNYYPSSSTSTSTSTSTSSHYYDYNYNYNNYNLKPTWNTKFASLPDYWILMNHGNITMVRALESKAQQVNQEVIEAGKNGNAPAGPGVIIRNGGSDNGSLTPPNIQDKSAAVIVMPLSTSNIIIINSIAIGLVLWIFLFN